jgi:hypothetical protein
VTSEKKKKKQFENVENAEYEENENDNYSLDKNLIENRK